MKVLTKISKDMTREEWLRWRACGIGGSDASIVAGFSKFKSVFQLWLEKTGQIEPQELDSEYVHFGNVLEPIIKQEFYRRTGKKVRSKRMILYDEEFPFMICNLDGVVKENGETVLFEAKTASAFKQQVWEAGVPFEYVLQVQHYMRITGARKTYVAALVGGNHFYIYEVYRDEELIKQLIEMEKTFWEDHVLARKEPIADGSEATTEYLNEKYKECNGRAIELPEEVSVLCKDYGNICKQLKVLEEEKDALANQMKNYLKDNEIGIVGDYTISWKQVVTTGFDKKRLALENKPVYDQYSTKSSYRKFKVA